jgi:ligand-binding sensor domain-containing protein
MDAANDPSKVSDHHARQKSEMGLQNTSGAFNPNYIVSKVLDQDGSVWAGTWGGGLAHFDGSKWTNYTVDEGLPGNHIFMLHLDKKQQLWVGTNKGLTRYQNGKFDKPLTAQDGLFGDDVFSMAVGDDGSMWVGSFGGVAYFRPK